MENWGLITYREAQFLVQPNVTSPATEQGNGDTIIHELSHMWFGDLVTTKWF
jgi:aminopeptidase N